MGIIGIIIDSIASIVEGVVSALGLIFNKLLMQGAQSMLGYVVTSTGDFWGNSFIVELISLSQWVCRLIMFASFLVSFFDMAEDRAANKPVYASILATNFIKAMIFTEIAPLIGKYALQLCDQIVQGLNLAGAITNTFPNPTTRYFALFLLIASIYFLCSTLKRFGSMLIQSCTCFLYVASIARGDTTAMGSWGRQTTAIAITFLFQYFLFTFGIFFWLDGALLLAIAMWLSMGGIVRILDKYGMSTGSGGGASGAANMALQGISILAK